MIVPWRAVSQTYAIFLLMDKWNKPQTLMLLPDTDFFFFFFFFQDHAQPA